MKNTKRISYSSLAIIASVLVHMGVLVWKMETIALRPKERRVKVVLKSEKKMQVVASQKSKNQQRPKSSRFLGEQNQAFEHQSVAKRNGAFQEAGKGVKNGENRVSNRSRRGSEKISLADLSLKRSSQLFKPSVGTRDGAIGKSGLAQTSDYVEDIPLGDMTKINTTRFKYYGFYERIRSQLELFWGKSIREKVVAMHRAGRRMPASVDRITSLMVTLDSGGNIVNIQVKGSSGVRELDNAAVESFNQAGPFPNPPKGMIQNGKAQIEWGFVLKANG